MAGGKDWDKELAKIDRLMAKQGVPPDDDSTPAVAPKAIAKPSKKSGEVAPKQRGEQATPDRPSPGGLASVPFRLWLIAALAPLGAAAMFFWPYAKSCGTGLGLYLAGAVGVLAASIWTLHTAWRVRRGKMFLLGLMTLLVSMGLITFELLPRVGYAAEALTWTCSN